MVSLLADVVICAVLLGTGYYLFFSSAASSSTAASGAKKRKKAKGKKAAGASSAGGEIRLQDASPSLAKGVAAIAADIKEDAAGGKAKRQAPTSTLTSTSARTAAAQPKGKASFTVGSSASSSSNGDASDFPPLGAPAASSASSHPRPLAERKAQNTRRKTAVDDMIDPDDEELRAKTFKRTMRIVKPGQTTPTILDGGDDGDSESGAGRGDALFGREDDATERAERESAWQTVAVPKKPASSTIRISGSSKPTGSSPASASRNIPGLTEVSKKQRQNAARAAAEKASREAAEQERLARLAAHKRALENERSKAQQKERDKAKAREAAKTKRETLSGGMTAKVSDTGALIWE